MDRAPQRHHRASQGKRPCSLTGRWKGLPGGAGERWEGAGRDVRGLGQEKRGEKDGLAGEGRPVRHDRS